jgi:hypothetical protein
LFATDPTDDAVVQCHHYTTSGLTVTVVISPGSICECDEVTRVDSMIP